MSATSNVNDGSALHWMKSSHSSGEGGECVEVAADWRKSSYSGGNGGECVEVAPLTPAATAVRDSKRPLDAMLRFAPDAWADLLSGLSQSD